MCPDAVGKQAYSCHVAVQDQLGFLHKTRVLVQGIPEFAVQVVLSDDFMHPGALLLLLMVGCAFWTDHAACISKSTASMGGGQG